MNDRPTSLKRVLTATRLELALAGGVLAIVPIGAIAYGTEHLAPVLIVGVIALAYIALAVGSTLRAVRAKPRE